MENGQSTLQLVFTIKHMVISEVTGNFKDFDINVTSSKDDFTDAVVEAVIKTNTINTDNERRDADLKSDNFFNAEKFPEIKFKSTSFETVDENFFKIHGDLTIRDITKPVTFDATLNGVIKSSRGLRAGWKATLVINRFDYGLKWNRTIETGGLVAWRYGEHYAELRDHEIKIGLKNYYSTHMCRREK